MSAKGERRWRARREGHARAVLLAQHAEGALCAATHASAPLPRARARCARVRVATLQTGENAAVSARA